MATQGVWTPGTNSTSTTDPNNPTSGAVGDPISSLFGSQAEFYAPLQGASDVGQALETFYSLTDPQLEQLVGQLQGAGYVTKATKSPYDAWKALVIDAARAGRTVDEQLQAGNPDLALGLASLGGAGGAPANPIASVSTFNPADIQYIGNSVSQKLIGRALTADEANSIAADITRKVSDVKVKGQTAISEQPTSPQAATQQYLMQHDTGQYQTQQMLNVFQAIQNKVLTDAQIRAGAPTGVKGPVRV